jgi:LysM repeat protein
MYKIYQVESGETLESIASKLGTDIDTLKQINGIIGNVSLMPGSFIIIPMVDDRFVTYTVKQGDTIYSISKTYNVDPNMILKMNGLNKDDYIYPNQQIMIPNTNYNFYITEKGDTLTKVSDALGKSISEIVNSNEMIYLEPDQMIIYR